MTSFSNKFNNWNIWNTWNALNQVASHHPFIDYAPIAEQPVIFYSLLCTNCLFTWNHQSCVFWVCYVGVAGCIGSALSEVLTECWYCSRHRPKSADGFHKYLSCSTDIQTFLTPLKQLSAGWNAVQKKKTT